MPSKKRSSSAEGFDYKFKKDEKALVLPRQHNDDIYEVKILECKVDNKTKQAQYKIHYRGWNKRWDEWVDGRRLLKVNPTNLAMMKGKKNESAQTQHDSSPNGDSANQKKRKLKPPPSASNYVNKKRKLNKHEHEEDEDADNGDNDEHKKHRSKKAAQNALQLKLPTMLKRLLIKDWENITKKAMLIELPRRPGHTISDIMTEFEHYAIAKGQDANIVKEISRGIKDYFNQALKVTLLYKGERAQYSNIYEHHSNLSMDQIYGAEHLCRLFVKLPQLLSPNDLDTDTKQILKQQIEFIINFLLSDKEKYFGTKYTKVNH